VHRDSAYWYNAEDKNKSEMKGIKTKFNVLDRDWYAQLLCMRAQFRETCSVVSTRGRRNKVDIYYRLGVWPDSSSKSGRAPFSRSSFTTLLWPLAAARDSGVRPDSSSKSGLAPFSRSSFAIPSSPFSAARDNGVLVSNCNSRIAHQSNRNPLRYRRIHLPSR